MSKNRVQRVHTSHQKVDDDARNVAGQGLFLRLLRVGHAPHFVRVDAVFE